MFSKCITGNCPEPGSVDNGSRSPTNGPYHHGDEVVITCDPAYGLKCDSAIVCTSTGQFNKPMPTCVDVNSGWVTSLSACMKKQN